MNTSESTNRQEILQKSNLVVNVPFLQRALDARDTADEATRKALDGIVHEIFTAAKEEEQRNSEEQALQALKSTTPQDRLHHEINDGAKP